MWHYFYYDSCTPCKSIHAFMTSISGLYDIEFHDVYSDWWAYANSVGVTKVPSLYNGVDIFTLGHWSEQQIIDLLES